MLYVGCYWQAELRLITHLDAELPVAGERDTGKLNFEIFVLRIIFDRNSNVRFSKDMVATGLQKSLVHDRCISIVKCH
jgi:hypothetical protein